MTAVLQVRNLVKRYGEHTVLDGVDIEVAEHEVVVLIGASGSGKSTLLRCVNLQEDLDDGQILLDGVDVSDPRVNADVVRRKMGVVFQAFNLFPHLSVVDNVTLAPRVVHGVDAAAARERALALLARVGLQDKASAYPDRLSGGQQQRVAIVRALAYEPRLLLLDEITSALDPELVGEVLAVIRDLAASGMTMIVVTHEIGFAREVGDQVVFMDGGVVVEQGDPKQVLDNPREDRTQKFLGLVLER